MQSSVFSWTALSITLSHEFQLPQPFQYSYCLQSSVLWLVPSDCAAVYEVLPGRQQYNYWGTLFVFLFFMESESCATCCLETTETRILYSSPIWEHNKILSSIHRLRTLKIPLDVVLRQGESKSFYTARIMDIDNYWSWTMI